MLRHSRIVVLIALAALACARRSEAPARSRVVLGVSALRISGPVFVALSQGLFARRGIDVELRRFDTAQPIADELAGGRIDAGGYVAFPILFGPGTQGQAPPRVVTAIVEDARHPISYLLVKKGSGLRGTVALKGRSVGILPTIAYRRWLEAILRHDGVDPAEVKIVPMAPPLEVDALASGGVDALFTGDPMATAALARGVAEPASETPDVPRVLGDPFLFGTFAVSDALARQRPAVARALADALDEAIGRMAGDPSLARAAMRPFLRDSERPFVDRYPEARYLRSNEVGGAALERALGLAGSSRHAADIALAVAAGPP